MVLSTLENTFLSQLIYGSTFVDKILKECLTDTFDTLLLALSSELTDTRLARWFSG